MAIDTKRIQVCLWNVISFSMKSCYNFVKKYPAFSSVSFFFLLLYCFLPTVFTFLIYSLLVFISTVGVYRVFFRSDHRSSNRRNSVNVESYKKNDSIVGEDPRMGTNGSISDNSQAARARTVDREDCRQIRNIEDKSMVRSTKSNNDLVDKSAVLEENLKDIKEMKVDSCGFKGETECSEDIREDRNKDVEWTMDDQKNLMDLGVSEVERHKKLESMIARRKARKLLSLQVRNTLMSPANNDHVDHLASILVPRSNHFVSNNSNEIFSPGSAPSVLLPMHNPFDIPYDTNEELPNLTGDSFHQEFLAENHKDLLLCRHESFRWGAIFPLDTMEDQCDIFTHDIPFKPKAPRKLKNPVLGSDLENNNVSEVIDKESSQEREAISNGGNAEDHATQESQASRQAPDSIDIHHEEDKSEIQKKETLDENMDDKSNSSSSSEENMPICRPNKDAILRSLTSLRRNVVLPKDDDYEVIGFMHDSDQSMPEDSKTEDQFFYIAPEIDHSRCNSLASDLQVEVSEVSSPPSFPSPREEYSTHCEDMKIENNSGSEETGDISGNPSRVYTGHESNSGEVPEISEEQDIFEVGVSRINQEALPNSSENHNRSSKPTYDLTDAETPTNNLENLNTANNIDNGAHKGIIQERDPGPSGGRNSNSSDHQSFLEPSTQIQQHERGLSCKKIEENSENPPSQNNLSDNPRSVQSNYSSRSHGNGTDEVFSEVEFPASSAGNETSGVVSDIETEQVPIISSPCSSPKLQPEFSSDQVSSTNLSRGISMEAQQSNNQIVENDLVEPHVNSYYSALQKTSPRTDGSSSQVPHDVETFQNPRFLDAISCVPFRPNTEEFQNHDASTPTSSSRFLQELQDSYPHQHTSNQEATTNSFADKLVVNDSKARINSDSRETNEGSSVKRETAAVEPSNSSNSRSTEDTKENPGKINGDEGAFGTSQATEENAKSGSDVKLHEIQEANLNDVANQPNVADAEDNPVANEVREGVFNLKQTELKDGSSNLVTHVDTKEPLDPPKE